MACAEIENIIKKFNTFTEKPVKFLTVQPEIKEDLKNLVKNIYDFSKVHEKVGKTKKKYALPELIVEDFDEEQIWQQIELQNTQCWDQLVWDVANCISGKNDLIFPVKISNELDTAEDAVDDEDRIFDDEDSASEAEQLISEVEVGKRKRQKQTSQQTKTKASIVDDTFFKLQEMEQFLLSEEKKDGKHKSLDVGSDEESVNMFEDDGDDEENDVMYKDFFVSDEIEENGDEQEIHYNEDQENGEMSVDEIEKNEKEPNNKRKKVRFAQASSSDDEDCDNSPQDNASATNKEKKSDFELRQQRLKQQIHRLEEKTLKQAPWQLKGEVDSSNRPQNSLLQEVVDFDLTTRPAPIITEQTTMNLEDIIKHRIKDKAWDDVVKKEKPVDDQLVFKKKEVLDHSKSELSLAQVYEAEYLKQKQALSGEVEEEKEPDSHKAVRNAMSQLFAKLDALCHYHYTPKAVQAEVKIVSNTPAISMEEVAPVATSDAALLAPEEIKKKQRGELMSKEERTKTDKNRERRKKKKFQREKGSVEKVTDHRNTKRGTEINNDKSLKTSKAFFQQLNDDSNSLIKNKNKRNFKNKGQ